jgi:hypothetical protein
MGLPEDDFNPYRHRYGDYTHLSRNGQYRFEWTPFTPAITAWQNAAYYLQQALADLADAQKSQGFALNGLAQQHEKMVASIKQFAKELELSHTEAGKVVKVLENAHKDYSAANEASLEQYQSLMRLIDGVTTGQTTAHKKADGDEKSGDESAEDQLKIDMGEKKPGPTILAPGPIGQHPYDIDGGSSPSSSSSPSGGGLV